MNTTQQATTTQPSNRVTSVAAASPSAREVIEWVYECKAVTTHDATKYFKLDAEDATRVLLHAGVVADDGVWSLASEHEHDPDAAVDAWMDRHGPDADRPLLDLIVEPPPEAKPGDIHLSVAERTNRRYRFQGIDRRSCEAGLTQ